MDSQYLGGELILYRLQIGISLLEPGVYARRWEQYCGEQPAFELIDELMIVGKSDVLQRL